MTMTTTRTTINRTLRYGKGYRGRLGNKCWAARITGTDDHFGLLREFLEPVSVEREHFNRSRTIVQVPGCSAPPEWYDGSQEPVEWAGDDDGWYAIVARPELPG